MSDDTTPGDYEGWLLGVEADRERYVCVKRTSLAVALRAAELRGAERMRAAAIRMLRQAPRAGGVLVPIEASNPIARFADDIAALDIDAVLRGEP